VDGIEAKNKLETFLGTMPHESLIKLCASVIMDVTRYYDFQALDDIERDELQHRTYKNIATLWKAALEGEPAEVVFIDDSEEIHA